MPSLSCFSSKTGNRTGYATTVGCDLVQGLRCLYEIMRSSDDVFRAGGTRKSYRGCGVPSILFRLRQQ
ncbi:hypothetical protein OESDEN_22662 [Oesophagostomum dentatum]|uniref:Uncharacterized protein n=1 Tax=Oesophagostomum dentatum TaxID=61180 RepID=A0A0B1RXD0_OESDE|nr:hypothetical protein OESDEN_22662 [Oesophagostomum dentatum]